MAETKQGAQTDKERVILHELLDKFFPVGCTYASSEEIRSEALKLVQAGYAAALERAAQVIEERFRGDSELESITLADELRALKNQP